MIYKYAFLIALTLLLSCSKEEREIEYNPLAIEYNNRAVMLDRSIFLGIEAPEKIVEVIALLDTAIYLDSTYISAYHNRLNYLLRVDSVRARKAFDEIDAFDSATKSKFDHMILGMISDYFGNRKNADIII